MYDYECYQKEQLTKELLLLENHLANFKCQHCIKKHRLTTQALAEETIKITPHDKERSLLRELINDGLINIYNIRQFRLKLMDMTPNSCGLKVKKNPSKLSRCAKKVAKTIWCKENRCNPYAVCKSKGV